MIVSLQGDNVSGSWFIVGLCDNALQDYLNNDNYLDKQ